MTDLTEGSEAPALDLPTDDGGRFNLAEAKGPVVIFFYPKADTPACTSTVNRIAASTIAPELTMLLAATVRAVSDLCTVVVRKA